jgi:hypothetical protein
MPGICSSDCRAYFLENPLTFQYQWLGRFSMKIYRRVAIQREYPLRFFYKNF